MTISEVVFTSPCNIFILVPAYDDNLCTWASSDKMQPPIQTVQEIIVSLIAQRDEIGLTIATSRYTVVQAATETSRQDQGHSGITAAAVGAGPLSRIQHVYTKHWCCVTCLYSHSDRGLRLRNATQANTSRDMGPIVPFNRTR